MSMRMRLLPVVAGLVISVNGGTALAAIPAEDGTFTGCVAAKSGTLRLVDRAGLCKAGEKVVTWNQQGPAGPQGPAGASVVSSFSDVGGGGAEEGTLLQPDGIAIAVIDHQFEAATAGLRASLNATIRATQTAAGTAQLTCQFVNDPDTVGYDPVNNLSERGPFALELRGSNQTGTLAFTVGATPGGSIKPSYHSVFVSCRNWGTAPVRLDAISLTGVLAPAQ